MMLIVVLSCLARYSVAVKVSLPPDGLNPRRADKP
jgi:hypothetical protein